jgi:hypothetical protein
VLLLRNALRRNCFYWRGSPRVIARRPTALGFYALDATGAFRQIYVRQCSHSVPPIVRMTARPGESEHRRDRPVWPDDGGCRFWTPTRHS